MVWRLGGLDMKYNLIGKRYYYFLFSLLVIIPGIIGLAMWGLPFSIDFTSGSMLEVKFESGKLPQPAEVISLYDQFGLKDARVQTTAEGSLIIRSINMTNDVKTQIITEMEKRFNDKLTILRFDTVGPSIGQEVTSAASMAVGMAAMGILIYIWFAFRNIPNAYRYGISAVIAMLHDVLVVIGVQTYLSHFFWMGI